MLKAGRALQLCLIVALAASLQACSKDNSADTKKSTGNGKPKTTATSAAPEPKKVEIKWDTETLKNDSGKTMIKCLTKPNENHMSFAIVSSKGTVALAEPNRLNYSKGLPHADIITASFINHDHTDAGLIRASTDAKVSQMTAETFTVKDITVTGIAASHTPDPVDPSSPSSVIYVFDVDGLRIAYMGGIGQDQLTDDQLKQLGKVDVVLAYFNDSPTWNVKKEITVKVLQQVKAPIVLPSEYNEDASKFILDQLKVKELTHQDALYVSKDDIQNIKAPEYIFLDS